MRLTIRGLISSVTAAAGKLARATITGGEGETIDSREMVGQYGFSSRPKAGAEALLLRNGCELLVIATDDRRYRIALDDGDVAVHTGTGQYVKLKAAGGIEVKSSGSVSVQGSAVELGSSTGLQKLVDERVLTLLNAHVHTGVTTGPGSSGPPATPIVAATVTTALTKAN